MPYWFEKEHKRIGKERDKRRKLTDDQIQEIIRLRNSGIAIRKLARMFHVDRNTIKWHTDPEYRKHFLYLRKLKNWYYDRDKQREAIRRYRKRLKEIYGSNRPKESN